MRRSASTRIVVKALALLAVPSILVLIYACQTVQPVLDVGASLGVATGTISQSQADSIKKTATAVGKTFEDITPEQEYYIGRAVAATVLYRYPAYTNDAVNSYVNRVGQTLAQASDRPETFGGYHFLVVDSPEINAFAAPGGLILVTRGMVRLCKNEDALAAVLAHEIGHIQGQHGLKSIRTSRLTSAFGIIAQEGIKQAGGGDIAQLTEIFGGCIGDITSTLVNNGYSRDLEREADQTAVTILRRVGYDPQALIVMLNSMGKELKPGGPDFAKTHPAPADRIRDIEPGTAGKLEPPAPPARQARFERAVGSI